MKTMAQHEKEIILAAMKECENNQTKVAKFLGISLRTLQSRLKEYEEPSTRKYVKPVHKSLEEHMAWNDYEAVKKDKKSVTKPLSAEERAKNVKALDQKAYDDNLKELQSLNKGSQNAELPRGTETAKGIETPSVQGAKRDNSKSAS